MWPQNWYACTVRMLCLVRQMMLTSHDHVDESLYPTWPQILIISNVQQIRLCCFRRRFASLNIYYTSYVSFRRRCCVRHNIALISLRNNSFMWFAGRENHDELRPNIAVHRVCVRLS